ncbi:glycosyltransferase family 2 protein [Bombella apis]|uniref:glycosyltransferase family 2 protein n=2 Tax=Bombella apis TaxID=1785988 RepID=UPI0012B7AB37|nr:glycosyltransferase family 2 protein [Bombella apis]MPV99013.1 glycosyltransferase [Bombella apis]
MAGKLGIGIITYNRKDILKEVIASIRRHTRTTFEFVVADDGSTDGTPDMLKELNVPCVTGRNKGISWNRNRVLWYLKEEKRCDWILILEDDCFPTVFGWELPWIEAIERYGHINFMPEITIEIDNDISSGSGTPEDPFIAPMHQAFCVGYHAKALSHVGYLDVRFEKYGEEHVEHTQRFLRAGYGGLAQHLSPERGQLFYLRGGLNTLPSHSHGNHELAMRNQAIHDAIRHEPLYRHPWRTDEQMFEFREEIAAALSRPSPEPGGESLQFDSIISLGGDETVNQALNRYFGRPGPGLFDQFLVPFHTLVSLFQNSFAGLLSTNCLYGHHKALRCRDTLITYHNCLDKPEEEPASVEKFHEQLPLLRHRFHGMIQEIDTLCRQSRRVLFIRSWRDGHLYGGQHRPAHTATANFTALVEALAARYPALDFKVMFVNFGDATTADQRMIFANTKTPDTCSKEEELAGWTALFSDFRITQNSRNRNPLPHRLVK